MGYISGLTALIMLIIGWAIWSGILYSIWFYVGPWVGPFWLGAMAIVLIIFGMLGFLAWGFIIVFGLLAD